MQRVETEEPARQQRPQRDVDTEWPAAWPEGLEYLRVHGEIDATKPVLPFLPVILDEASPSTRFVYACFRLGVAKSVEGLRQATGLPARTVRHAVRWLVDRGLMERISGLTDARRVFLREPPRGTAQHASAVFVFA